MPVKIAMSPSTETPSSTTDQPSSFQPLASRMFGSTVRRKAGAEFVGTFMIVFSAAAGSIVDQKYGGVETLVGKAAGSGLAVMIAVISTGHISKAHLNPAVTLAFTTLRHFPWAEVPAYVAAQVAGSVLASFLLKAAYHPFMSGGVVVPSVGDWQAVVLEFIATFFLMFVIAAVATDPRAVGALACVGIGGTVMLDILLIGPATGASMNPVRTLGPALAAGRYHKIWIYMVAPPAGAIAGAAAYELVKLKEEEIKQQQPLMS